MKTYPDVSKVAVIFKTHLDIGFTDYSSKIVDLYLNKFIPGALKLAKSTRHSPNRFVWMTGSWLTYRFLEDSNRENRKLMEEAIIEGDFYWHALPFTTHTELIDPELFRFGLAYSRILDNRFGKKTTVAKMTDVPGHSIGMVPLLAEAGVKVLHIGVNPASSVPDVPSAFRWQAADKSEVIVIYDKVYGATSLLPGGFALSVNLTNDNLGPQNPKEIDSVYNDLRKRFPKAKILTSGLNSMADAIWKNRKQLPVITEEIGDTWIHGVGTDPLKVSTYLAVSRMRKEWLRREKLSFKNFETISEGLLLTAEHTWGMDIKTHLNDWKNYSLAQVKKSLNKPAYKKVAQSWDEQRNYVRTALKALPTSLQKEAQKEISQLKPTLPSTKGWQNAKAGQEIHLGKWSLSISKDGAIRKLLKANSSKPLAEANHPLALLSYQTYSWKDYVRFHKQYNTLDVEWSQKDFTKVGLPASALSRIYTPTLKNLWIKPDEGKALLKLSIPCASAAQEIFVTIEATEDGLDIELDWFKKPTNRMPEAYWFQFNPALGKNTPWKICKMGSSINPIHVVSKGNRSLHVAQEKISAGNFEISSLDTPLVAPGKPSLLDFNNRLPDMKHGISYNLYNNAWNTNFPMWYSEDAKFTFQLKWNK